VGRNQSRAVRFARRPQLVVKKIQTASPVAAASAMPVAAHRQAGSELPAGGAITIATPMASTTIAALYANRPQRSHWHHFS